jgi:hypothetical protein
MVDAARESFDTGLWVFGKVTVRAVVEGCWSKARDAGCGCVLGCS